MPFIVEFSWHQVVTDSHSNRIQKLRKKVRSLVAFIQPCHGGDVVNGCWREGDVPSLDMAACLGRSGLLSHPLIRSAGMGCPGRFRPEAGSY